MLKLCVKSIRKYCDCGDYEIIITDSESISFNKLFIKDNFPDTRFIGFKDNVGYAKLVNAGIRMSRGDFILILNADIIVTKNSIEVLLDLMKKNPTIGLAGPRLLQFNGKPQNSCFKFYNPFTVLCRRTFLRKLPLGKKAIDEFLMKKEIACFEKKIANAANSVTETPRYMKTDWLMGSALMARREAIDKIGLVDEGYFMYFEDVDWSKRFWNGGYKVVYCPESRMYHYHQKTSLKKGGFFDILTNKYTRIHIKSAFRYFKKFGLR